MKADLLTCPTLNSMDFEFFIDAAPFGSADRVGA